MKKIVVFLLVLVICFGLWGCMFGRPANVMGKFKLCDTCKTFVVGKWYVISDDQVYTYEYRADGTVIGGEDPKWNCACKNDEHAIRLGGDNYTVGLTHYDPEDGTLGGLERDEGYTFVQLTQDNWREYFSEDFSQVFDVRYMVHTIEETDAWGDTTVRYVVIKYATMKDPERFGPMNTLMLELDETGCDEMVTIDPVTLEVLDAQVEQVYDTEKKTVDVMNDDEFGMFLLLGSENFDTLEVENRVYLYEPGTIYRMKGVLVLK